MKDYTEVIRELQEDCAAWRVRVDINTERIKALEARLKRLGSKESMTLQIIVGNVEPKFDYKAEYFTRIDYANGDQE